jgi:hypothetical protein
MRRSREEARTVMGEAEAAVVVACLLQRSSTIQSAGGYLRELTRNRDHTDGRAIASAGPPDAGEARRSQIVVLSMVRPFPAWRPGGLGRSPISAGSGLEPHPRSRARPGHRSSPRTARAEPPRTGGALHRRRRSILSRKPRSTGCSRRRTSSPARPTSSSRRPKSSRTRRRRPTSSGRRTSPI